MSTLTVEALLAFKRQGNLNLCQEFICFNPARLPTPAQWVNIERTRVKDAFTRLWWLSPSDRPKADNRRVLVEYSEAMKRLLRTGSYNGGPRPSEHHIGVRSFLRNNDGAIPPNVLTIANTTANDPVQVHCRRNGYHPHPARMPPSLAQFFIKFLTERGDIVMDPFAGTNTTGAVAEELHRRWRSIEIDRGYADLAAVRSQRTIGPG